MMLEQIHFEYNQGALVVVPHSSLKCFNASSYLVDRIVDEIGKTMAEKVVMDLQNIPHMDSFFAMMLLVVKNTLIDMGLYILIINANSQAQRVLEIVGLHKHLLSA